MQYVTFDLDLINYRLENGVETFQAMVTGSPAGAMKYTEANTVSLPADLRSGREMLLGLRMRALNPDEMIELGGILFDALFPGTVRALFMNSMASLEPDQGLRIQLHLDHNALSAIPWEYAYIHDMPPLQPDFLVLIRRVSLVREEVIQKERSNLDVLENEKLRFVALLSSPDDYPPLDLNAEEQNIREALKPYPNLELDIRLNATEDDLYDALARPAHIFHFAGHGDFTLTPGSQTEGIGSIILTEDGRGLALPADELAKVLSDRGVRLAVFTACSTGERGIENPWSGVAPALIFNGIPAVVGMQHTISDENAKTFSKRFYRAMVAGQPIDAAVSDGRMQIYTGADKQERDWGVPVLYFYLYPGKNDGILFPSTLGHSWEEIRQHSRDQLERILPLDGAQLARSSPFIPQIYLHREDAESELHNFLDGDRPGMILVGEAGVGKTNLVYQLASNLYQEGHCALLYNCGGSLLPDIEAQIAQDLSLGKDQNLPTALEELAALAEGKHFAIIFDAVNQFRGEGNIGPEELLKSIDRLVGWLPGRSIHVILTCTSADWSRMERLGHTQLNWNRYHNMREGQPLLRLEVFTPEEFSRAYELYRVYFDLHTPLEELHPVLRERLRSPLLLRMLAETYRGHEEPIDEDLSLNIFDRYLQEHIQLQKERDFIQRIADLMLQRLRGDLPRDDLSKIPELQSEMVESDPDCAYNRLLDKGILVEIPGSPLIGPVVRFAHAQVGAYVLANYLVNLNADPLQLIFSMSKELRNFPSAWDVARIGLILTKKPDVFATLAQSDDIELRELVFEALVDLHTIDPAAAKMLVDHLLGLPDAHLAWRTALKAAYFISPAIQEIYVQAVVRGSPELRLAARDTLYLIWNKGSLTHPSANAETYYVIWRCDPGFIFGLLRDLAKQLSLSQLLLLRSNSARNILEFILDLSITIYINHCDRKDLVQLTSDLWFEIFTNRLGLNKWLKLPEAMENWLIQVVGTVFSGQLLKTALLTEVFPAEPFFNQSDEQRALFKRMVPLVDPQAEIHSSEADLAALLQSELPLANVLAGMILAIHAYQDFSGTQPLLESLFNEMNGHGRLWELIGFAILLQETPVQWIPLLETFTGRLLAENPEIFSGQEAVFLQQFNILFAPLGLAYGKTSASMPFFEQLLRESLEIGDMDLARGFIRSLGTVGFYYPQTFFTTLKAAIPDLRNPDLEDALVDAFAVVHTLHFDAVDSFMNRNGFDEQMHRRVSAVADVGLVRRFIIWLGIYNNAVHQALFYPRMRRQLLIGGLNALADARKAEDFIGSYSPVPLHMAREAKFRLSEWTLPE